MISSLHCLNQQEQKQAVKELHRILKPNSKILLGVWNKFFKKTEKKKRKRNFNQME
jgi:predicted SAM-dependent methyltransferase